MLKTAGRASRKLLKMCTVVFIPLLLLLSLCLPAQAGEPAADQDAADSSGLTEGSPELDEQCCSGELLLDPLLLSTISQESGQLAASPGLGSSTLFSDGFEGSFPGSNWKLYSKTGYGWATTNYQKHSGAMSIWCAASHFNPATSNYPSGMLTQIMTGPFDLSNAESGKLSFYLWLKTQLVTNSNPSTGDILIVMAYTGTGDYAYGWDFYSQEGKWANVSLDLTKWSHYGDLCGKKKVYFIFGFQSNTDAVTDKGAFVDDITLTVGPKPPSAPKLASPKNGAKKIGLTPELSWNLPQTGAAESYNIQVATESSFSDPLLEDEVYDDTYFEVPEDYLDWNTKYFWRVNATDSDGGNSDWSKVFSFTTAVGPPPEPPSDLEAEAKSSKQVYLTWGDNSENETGFYLERKKESDSGFKQIAKLKADVAEYTDTKSLVALTAYNYRICAYNKAGNSVYTDIVEVTTLTEPPSPPAPLSPKNGAKKIGKTPELTWKAPKVGEAAYYGVEVAADSKFETVILGDDHLGDLYYDIPDGNLEWNTRYFWRVNATNSEWSTSDWSKAFNFTTAAGPPPEPPSDLEAEVISSQQVQLYWTDNSEDESGFYLERKKSSETAFKQIAKLEADVEEYVDGSKLSAETQYEYRLCAYNGYGNSNYTDIVTITTWPAPPKAPTLSSPANNAKISDLTPELTWNAPSGSEVDYYELQVATDSVFEDCWIDETGITDLFYQVSDGDLDYETTYYWHVRAVNETDDMDLTSDWSSYRKFTTPAEPEE
jgi:hypothetical protein